MNSPTTLEEALRTTSCDELRALVKDIYETLWPPDNPTDDWDSDTLEHIGYLFTGIWPNIEYDEPTSEDL